MTIEMGSIATPPAGTVLDLFAGAGGMSLGFEQAGFSIETTVEIDAWACQTLRRNHPTTQVLEADISLLTDQQIEGLVYSMPAVVIGGPPCQGFSHSMAGPRRDPADPRNSLFREFVRTVKLLQPPAFVMENVPGLLRTRAADGRLVIDIISECFEEAGYALHVATLDAADFGVPQFRRRVFIFGSRVGDPRAFEPPTTHVEDGPMANLWSAPRRVTVSEAIGDLPSAAPPDDERPVLYDREPENDYQRLMRHNAIEVWNHQAMRHTKRLVERFSHIRPGQSGADAPANLQARGRLYPGTMRKVFDQNNRRLRPNRPSHTVAATFYANLLHPTHHRNLTPREGARLQSFPDWFVFMGRKTTPSRKLLEREGRLRDLHLTQYNQIGNAVPPLLARAIASAIAAHLTWTVSEEAGLSTEAAHG